MPSLTLNNIDHALLDLALHEDLQTPFVDVTTHTLFSHNNLPPQSVKIVSKSADNIIICGIPIIRALLEKFTPQFTLTTSYQDGDSLPPSQTLLSLTSDARTLLMAERTLLNFLRHLSAIATLTNQFVSCIQHTHTKILDTRKTTPGMRHLEKYAVQCGGGVNHRMGLYDAYMIKDTHVDLMGNMANTLAQLPEHSSLPVIVEVRSITELQTVIQHGKNKVTRVLLDNMSLPQLAQCVKLCRDQLQTEASGNINLGTIQDIAQTGVDYASVGMLTYGAGQVDLSMQTVQ